jgi:metallo-beta-lactamase class B
MRHLVVIFVFVAIATVSPAQDNWNTPQEPFRMLGNTYYVGTAGLSAILITSDAGHMLIDGALPQSAAIIEKNISALGFRLRDIRLLLNSHEHFDHAGGLAALQRSTSARVAASPAAARALRQGHPTLEDPQYQSSLQARFETVQDVEIIADRATLRVGPLAVTAHFTPGHTPGATTWSWRSCERTRCVDIVYADSLTPVSDDGFKFTGDEKHPPIVDAFRRSITRVEALPCDVVLAPHPEFIALTAKLARLKERPDVNPFVEENACRTYAATARKRLEQRVAAEMK